jgi:lipopolysaccharide transport system ATP-binding protein
MTSEVLVSAEKVSKKFCKNFKKSLWHGVQDISAELLGRNASPSLRSGEFWAVDQVSFELRRGDCLGLIGRNGAGKTTLLKMLNGLIKPDHGKITMRGRVGALIALGAGFNPVLTGRENIYINGSILGLTKKEIDEKCEEIIDFAELGGFIDTPVRNYSSGMQVRLGFSIATTIVPDVLILDEVLAVGDTPFRVKCFQRIGRIMSQAAVLFVSHDPVQVSRICNQVLLLRNGAPAFLGDTNQGLDVYLDEIAQTQKSTPSKALAEEIKDCRITIEKSRLQHGEILKLKLTILSEKAFTPGLCLIALGCRDAFLAQCEFTHFLPSISKGENHCHISIGPLHLRKDQYSVSITILDETKKQTLIHVLHAAEIFIEGKRGYGVAYQPPLSGDVTQKTPLKTLS